MPDYQTFIWGITTSSFTLVGFLFWSRFRTLEIKTREIEKNYTNEFKLLRDTISCMEKKILDKLSNIRDDIQHDFVLKEFCQIKHQQKGLNNE